MRRFGRMLAGAALASLAASLGLAQVSPPPLPHAEISPADRAADAEALKYYPDRAWRERVQGVAQLSCTRDAHAALKDCVLKSETPKGYDFGAAALRLSTVSVGRPDMNLPPTAGVPEQMLFCLDPPGITPNPLRATHVIVRPDWERRATAAQMAAAWPKAAQASKLSGRAVLQCDVRADGVLADCSVIDERPAGQGFGAAALKLAGDMLMKPMTYDGQPRAGGRVTLPLVFGPNPPPPLPPAPPPPPAPPLTLAQACAGSR